MPSPRLFVRCLLLCVALSICAHADRMPLPPADITLSEPGQKAIIAFNGEEEILILKTDLTSTKKHYLVEMLPFPNLPEASLAEDDFLQRFQSLVKAKNLRFGPVYRSGGSTGVEVVSHQQLGPHELRVLKVSSVEDLWEFLDPILKEKGLARPPLTPQAKLELEGYLEQRMYYFVLDIVEVGPETISVAPILYRFETETLFYPLRTSNVVGGEGVVELYFLTEGTDSDNRREAVVDHSRRYMLELFSYYDSGPRRANDPAMKYTMGADISKQEIADSLPEFQDLFPANATLQAYRYSGPLRFGGDVELEPAWLGMGRAHQAAEKGDLEALKKSDDGNIQDQFSRTPLHWAAELGHLPLMEYLLSKKSPRIDQRERHGATALHWAVFGGEQAVRTLLEAGANPNLTDFGGETPMYWAAARKKMALADLLIEYGADVNLASERNANSAIFIAARNNKPQVVEYYLRHGANLAASNKLGQTALHAAVSGRHLSMVELLLKLGVPIDSKDAEGNTAIMLTSTNYNSKIFRALVDGGASLDIKNATGRGPLDIAIQQGWTPEVEMLLEKGATFDRASAAAKCPLELMELVLRNGADPNAVNAQGSAPLHRAAKRPELVRLLLDKGADPNSIDDGGRSPLHQAAIYGESHVITLLLKHGADKSLKDKRGKRPVDFARDAAVAEMLE